MSNHFNKFLPQPEFAKIIIDKSIKCVILTFGCYVIRMEAVSSIYNIGKK